MICQLLKSLAWVILFAGGIAACTQVDMPSQMAQSSSGHLNNNKSVLGHASTNLRLFGQPTATGGGVAPPVRSILSSFSPRPLTLWDHMRQNFKLPQGDNNPEVQAQIRWYVHHQQDLNRTINRAAPYMYFIFEQVQQRNLPAELVLLPIMESAYNPFANSNRGAVGLWQLIHTTAYGLGVKQDWWYDGRRDIYASTNAALDYLTYLQNYFSGNWMLAIGAYDAGEGAIQNAVRRNSKAGRDTDFWSLKLSAETRSYVPRLLALASIINNPAKYSITLPQIDDHPYLQQVDLGAPINLDQAAKLAGLSLGQLKQLNPGYSHMMTGPNGPYKLLLPIDRIVAFKENLAASPGLEKTTWAKYKVKKGDTLTKIAGQYHVGVTELCQTNSIKGHKAPVGRTLMIACGKVYVKPNLTEVNNNTASAVAQNQNIPNQNVSNQNPNTANLVNLASNEPQNATANPFAPQATSDVGPSNNSFANVPANSNTGVMRKIAAGENTLDNVNDLSQAAKAKKLAHSKSHGKSVKIKNNKLAKSKNKTLVATKSKHQSSSVNVNYQASTSAKSKKNSSHLATKGHSKFKKA